MVKTLKGITWDHSRAYPPLVAVSQRYEELHPGVRIRWDKRTLDEFGHKPIDQLTADYDLIVIDHPWAGFCFDRDLVLDLSSHLSEDVSNELGQNMIGSSYSSYLFNDKLLAIPIDAATPAPSWRPDLIDKNNIQLPETWTDLIALADQKHVVMPGFGADLFLNWLMLLHALDADPFATPENLAEKGKAMEGMFMLKRLAESMPDEIFNWNPIRIAELMTRTDAFAYCAFAYSYGNYCRPSFVRHPLRYGNLVNLNGQPLRSILGGTGIAISSGCDDIAQAVDFSLYCADENTQANLYTYAGGQPVHRGAWKSHELDSFTGGFFSGSFETHEHALVRPRYNGYVSFQEKAGVPLQQFVKGELSADRTWEVMGKMYRASRMARNIEE